MTEYHSWSCSTKNLVLVFFFVDVYLTQKKIQKLVQEILLTNKKRAIWLANSHGWPDQLKEGTLVSWSLASISWKCICMEKVKMIHSLINEVLLIKSFCNLCGWESHLLIQKECVSALLFWMSFSMQKIKKIHSLIQEMLLIKLTALPDQTHDQKKITGCLCLSVCVKSKWSHHYSLR